MRLQKTTVLLAAAWGLAMFAGSARADLKSDSAAAVAALRGVMPRAGELLANGKLEEANALILATFPEKTRTAAQAYMLANVLFPQSPEDSYALHKRAATDLADDADVQLEWAMEQHRAGEYNGATESYAKYSKANPDFAPAYGMMAECLIRTGKVKEAVAAWQQSEKARSGSVETLEEWVCDVNGHRYPQRERADLLVKVAKGDIAAAECLIALDTEFPRDWWNRGPQVDYLKRDLATLRGTKFESKRIGEIIGAGECALAADAEEPVDGILKKAGFLLDEKGTLPGSGVMLSSMLESAFSTHALTKAQARIRWGETLLEKVKTSTDADLINVAANLYLGTDKLPEIDARGWEATGDPRFAASLLLGLQAKGNLKLDDPQLVKAAKQFPDNCYIAAVVLRLTVKEGKPLQAPLIAAIEAEYRGFSRNELSLRPGAGTLRTYFAMLAKEPLK